MGLAEKIKTNPRLKKIAHFLLIPQNQYKPRWWVRNLWSPWVHHKGKRVVISRKARRDLFPFNPFSIDDDSFIEDFAVLNNALGPIRIGKRSLVGIGTVIIGPVTIGNDILIAQNCVITGQNHNYLDVNLPITRQKDIIKETVIKDQAWIGANVVIVPGVTIGIHSVVAAGSVVTKNVPDYTIVGGNPAKAIRQYNPQTNQWERL